MSSGKPPRMRSACNACHAAKVRCTGEKTGCARCRQSDMTCTYEVSLVGRMSRRKRRQKRDDKFGDPSAECLQCLAESAPGCLSPGKLIGPDAFYDSPCDPGQDGCDSKLQSVNMGIEFMDSAHFDGQTPMSYSMLPLSPDSILFSPGASSGLPVEEKCPNHQPLSPISEISKVLESLEAQVQSGSRSLDEILHVNKACMTNLTKIWAMEEYAKYRCCDMLTASALDLIVSLFEEAPTPVQGSTCDARWEGLPDVHFGVFEVDPEEQVAMAKRLVLRELDSCLQIIRGRFRREDPDCKPLAMQCGSVLERRVDSLISSLES